LLSARGVLATLAGAGFAVFLPALASFFDDALGLPPLAGFCALGALFFAVAPFFEEAFSCATVAPLFRNGGGGFGGGGFYVRHGGEASSCA
jgi:hypothetical protein